MMPLTLIETFAGLHPPSTEQKSILKALIIIDEAVQNTQKSKASGPDEHVWDCDEEFNRVLRMITHSSHL